MHRAAGTTNAIHLDADISRSSRPTSKRRSRLNLYMNAPVRSVPTSTTLRSDLGPHAGATAADTLARRGATLGGSLMDLGDASASSDPACIAKTAARSRATGELIALMPKSVAGRGGKRQARGNRLADRYLIPFRLR